MSDTTSYPYDTIAYITDTIAGQGWQGSGVLVSPDEVLTATHVVYSSTGGVASNITVTPGYNAGLAPFGSATATEIHYFAIQDPGDTISNQQSQFDYALIHLSKPFTGLGTMGLESDFSGGAADVSGYPASRSGQQDTSLQPVSQDPNYSLLDGVSIGKGSSGGPVWVVGSDGTPAVVGVVSSAVADAGSTGYFTQITSTAYNQIQSWIAQDDGTSSGSSAGAPLVVRDTTQNQTLAPATAAYNGPVSGVQNQYVNITTDNLNIIATTPNWFIHSGSGTDAITVSSGTNVLDGGTGSNFLIGGSGTDTFFVDDRGSTAATWSTIDNFHAGDAATIWGVTPADFALGWANGQGAAGYTGLTLHATATGQPTASLTFAGFTQADLSSGRLSVSYGSDPTSGSPYAYVQANS